MKYHKPTELSYIILNRYFYDYVLYQNLPEHYYITNINNNNITKISITSKITKLPHKLNYDLQELIKSIEAQTKARLRSNAQS